VLGIPGLEFDEACCWTSNGQVSLFLTRFEIARLASSILPSFSGVRLTFLRRSPLREITRTGPPDHTMPPIFSFFPSLEPPSLSQAQNPIRSVLPPFSGFLPYPPLTSEQAIYIVKRRLLWVPFLSLWTFLSIMTFFRWLML